MSFPSSVCGFIVAADRRAERARSQVCDPELQKSAENSENMKRILQISCIHFAPRLARSHTTKALGTEAREAGPKSRCSLSHVQALAQTQTKRPRARLPVCVCATLLCHTAAWWRVAQVRMLQVGRAWRSGPGGLEVLWGRRNHFLPGAQRWR